MGRPVVGKGGLGGPLEQVGRRRGIAAAARRLGPVVDLEGQLKVGEGIGQRIDVLGQGGRLDRRRAGRLELVRGQPVAGPRSGPLGQALGQGCVVAPALAGQQVGLDGPGDQGVAHADDRVGRQAGHRGIAGGLVAVRSFELGEPVFESIGQAMAEVRLEDAAAAPRGRAGAGSRPVRLSLEGQRGGRQLFQGQRLAGRGEQAQHAAAFGRATGQASDDQLVERAGQRRAGQLTPGGQQLLGHQGIAPRALRYQEQDRGRGALAFDPLDQPGELVPAQGLEQQALRRARRVGHRAERFVEGMAASQLVGLVGGHDAQPPRPRDPGQEGRQRPGSGVGIVEVLEDQEDGPALAETGQEAQDRLEHPRLTPLGVDRGRAGRQQPQRGQAGLGIGDQAQDLLGAGLDQGRQLAVRDAIEEAGEGDADRRVRIPGAARPGAAADHLERLGQAGQPLASLGQQPGDPHSAGAGDQEGRRAAGRGGLQGARNPGKFTLPPYEARARERRRHGRILGVPS